MVDHNAVAKYWAAQGGPNSHLGAVAAEPRPTPNGGQVARFVNGYVYAAPDGAIIELAGRLLDRFIQLGGDTGLLGLPLKDAYPIPDGMRSDFQNGSLIVNTVTGLVTTLYKIYSETGNPTGRPDAAEPHRRPGGPEPRQRPITRARYSATSTRPLALEGYHVAVPRRRRTRRATVTLCITRHSASSIRPIVLSVVVSRRCP